jgi:hypothetical protein
MQSRHVNEIKRCLACRFLARRLHKSKRICRYPIHVEKVLLARLTISKSVIGSI